MKKIILAATLASCFGSIAAQATIVEIQTSLGSFQVNLFDHDPAVKPTVDNFLKYVEGAEGYSSYDQTIIHRSVKNFVIQGGGLSVNDEGKLAPIKTAPVIKNAPVFSNVEATISMAKSNSIDSATSQWFINTKDNSASLDAGRVQGYTVFGKVISGYDTVIKDIASKPIYNMGANTAIAELPLVNYTLKDLKDNVPVLRENFIIIENITVIDARTDTASSLNPVKNTLLKIEPDDKDKKKSGGAFGIGMTGLIAALFGLALRSRTRGIAKK